MQDDRSVARLVDLEAEGAVTAGDVLNALASRGWTADGVESSALELSRPHEPGSAPIVVAWRDDVGSLLTSGDRLRAVPAGTADARASPLATVTVVSGPDRGLSVGLGRGEHGIGSGSVAVRLSDPAVAACHAVLAVGGGALDPVEIVDSGSATGILVDGVFAVRARVSDRAIVALGSTVLEVESSQRRDAEAVSRGAVPVTRNRLPVPPWDPPSIELPRLAVPPPRAGLPRLAMLAPALLGVGMFAMTGRATSLLLVAMSPLLAGASVLDGRLAMRRWARRAREAFGAQLEQVETRIAAAQARERRRWEAVLPPLAAVADAVVARGPLLWSTSALAEHFLVLRVGTGARESDLRVEVPDVDRDAAALAGIDLDRRDAAVEHAGTLDAAPVPIALADVGAAAVVGPQREVEGAARAMLVRLAATHAPSETAIAAFLSPAAAMRFEWLAWLPHVGTTGTVLGCAPVAADDGVELLDALERLVARRLASGASAPAVVVLVDDGSPADRARLIRLAGSGAAAGVHLLWVAADDTRVPAACGAVVRVTTGAARILDHSTGAARDAVEPDLLALDAAARLARCLVAVRDDGIPDEVGSEPPRTIGLSELHSRAGLTAMALAAGWGAARAEGAAPLASLRALVGRGAEGPEYLDLATDGPHALVGGTTGSGKSEFLQSWVLGMAAAHPPSRVTFLLVDYKGGSAFADCVRLPHCVGLVTDLTPELVDRALVSLRAEIRRREVVLSEAGAADLEGLLRSGGEAPPSLVIVVDEFAALSQEVPAFVDGMVDIAQRGRSLGVHLILATQRPAGVIRDRIRANTNLRIALRMADEADSIDVLGTPDAARLDRSVPGRVLARTGPGVVRCFQAAFAGSSVEDRARPAVTLCDAGSSSWTSAGSQPLSAALVPHDRPSDARTAVEAMGRAAADLRLPPPRRPWCEPLEAGGDVFELSSNAGEPCIGLVDDPGRQRQDPLPLRTRRAGPTLVIGSPGSGVSTSLRSAAVVALADAQTPTHVYAIDAAGGGLEALEYLPHVAGIVALDDREGVARVLALLSRPAADRGVRRMLLVDGVGPFTEALTRDRARVRELDDLRTVLSRGGQLAVDAVLGASRPGEVLGWVSALVARTVVLRLAEPGGYAVAAARGVLPTHEAPPGRGVVVPDGLAVQLAVPGVAADLAGQMRVAGAMAEQRGVDPRWRAPGVPRLPDRIPASRVRRVAGEGIVLGIESDTLAPLEVDLRRPIVVAGAPRSGRSTALAWLAHAARRRLPRGRLVLCTPESSALTGLSLWDDVCAGPDAGPEGLERWSGALGRSADEDRVVLVLEDVADLWPAFGDGGATLLREAQRRGHAVIGEAETSRWGAGGVSALLRASRRGLILQPQGQEAAQLLGAASVPSLDEWPPGRGVWVEGGRATIVHIPLA